MFFGGAALFIIKVVPWAILIIFEVESYCIDVICAISGFILVVFGADKYWKSIEIYNSM